MVVKGIGGFYYVADENGNVAECKAAGRFRHEKMTPVPGDSVEFIGDGEQSYAFIEEIYPRKNLFIRPAVANISQIVITVSAKNPAPDLLLVDRLLIQAVKNHTTPLILINKADVADRETLETITAQYRNVCDILTVSARTGEGTDALKQALKGHVTCFAGQSAVGKSSVLNSVMPMLSLKTGELSKKTERGRHTTRHAELILSPEFQGGVMDTPGFSMLETEEEEPKDLCLFYPDFAPYLTGCRFSECLHENEPDCSVKEAVAEGKIQLERYERYLKILKELKEKRLKKYD